MAVSSILLCGLSKRILSTSRGSRLLYLSVLVAFVRTELPFSNSSSSLTVAVMTACFSGSRQCLRRLTKAPNWQKTGFFLKQSRFSVDVVLPASTGQIGTEASGRQKVGL